MFFYFVLIFGLWDGECHFAKMVMIAAIGLSNFKDSPEKYQTVKRESVCLTENIYFSILMSLALAYLMSPSFPECKQNRDHNL